MAETHLAGTLAAAVAIADKPARERVLREAALLGVDLLSGEEPERENHGPGSRRLRRLERAEVEGLADGLNVFYGPNEAGKSTLLQFVRSMLYGFSPARRRYLPPVHGGRPGGDVEVVGPHGRFEIGRYDDPRPAPTGEQLVLTAADGTRQGEHFLKVLLSNVDEPIFNNVFAVGLREIQELATLSDTEAAELLYNLTAGLDRVSLVEVMRELETSRNRILDRDGRPCQVVQLLAEREKLRAEIEELRPSAAATAVWPPSGANSTAIRAAGGRSNATEHRPAWWTWPSRCASGGCSGRGWTSSWRRWVAEDHAGGRSSGSTPSAARLRSGSKRTSYCIEAEQSRAEAAAITVNEALWRQAARIEALQEQDTWLIGLQNQIDELEWKSPTRNRPRPRSTSGWDWRGKHNALPAVSPRTLATLGAGQGGPRHARALRRRATGGRRGRGSRRVAHQQIDAALAARGEQTSPRRWIGPATWSPNSAAACKSTSGSTS